MSRRKAGVLERAICPECKRLLAVRPPRGGDGSADVFPRHYALQVRLAPGQSRGERCLGSRSVVRPDEYVESRYVNPLRVGHQAKEGAPRAGSVGRDDNQQGE